MLEGRNHLVKLRSQLGEMVRSGRSGPLEQVVGTVSPRLEELTELMGQSFPAASSFGNVDRTARMGTIVPPTDKSHSNGNEQMKQMQAQAMNQHLILHLAEQGKSIRMFPPPTR